MTGTGKFANGAVTAAMAYAFNQAMNQREVQSGDPDAMQELKEMTKRERGALRAAVRDYRRWLNSLTLSEALEVWPESRSILTGPGKDIMFEALMGSLEVSLTDIELKSLAVDVGNQALMTFESATGNVAFASAARVSDLPLQSGWALFDAGTSSRGFFGIIGRRSPTVVVGCNVNPNGCSAVIGR